MSGDGNWIGSDDVEQWIADRPGFQFSFLGSCEAMHSTDPGTMSWSFSKGDDRNAAAGYIGMGEAGSGWHWSWSWQEYLFTLAVNEHVPIYEALLRAQTRFPQMAKNWGFWGNRDLILRVPRDRQGRPDKGADMMWKRAKGGPTQMALDVLSKRSEDVLLEQCSSFKDQLFLEESRVVTEEDTGALRQLFLYKRRVDDVLMFDDYVSVELDPADGELIGFHAALTEGCPTLSAEGISGGEVTLAVRRRGEALLRNLGVSYERGSISVGEPYLVCTTRASQGSDTSRVAFAVPIRFRRITGEEAETLAFVATDDGSVLTVLAPPPG